MTKEELEKEAKVQCFMLTVNTICIDKRDVELAYVMGAEPREKRIAELEAQVEQLTYMHNEDVSTIKLLNKQIEKMKLQYDYDFTQLLEAREIVCLMLSQYRDKKEIDYFTRERGEKLLKQGVYKND